MEFCREDFVATLIMEKENQVGLCMLYVVRFHHIFLVNFFMTCLQSNELTGRKIWKCIPQSYDYYLYKSFLYFLLISPHCDDQLTFRRSGKVATLQATQGGVVPLNQFSFSNGKCFMV